MRLPTLAAAILLLFATSASWAQLVNNDLPNREGVKVGNFILHSAFKASEDLDTNIYVNNSNKRADSITLINPSVGIEIPLRDNRISFDYDLGIFLYANYHGENHVDQRFRGLVEINLTDYKTSVNDEFRIYTDRASNENSVRIKRKINNLRAGVKAQFESLGFDLGYTNRFEIYDSNDISYQSITYEDRDRMYNIIDATISYRFLPKTLFLVENDLGFITYYNCSQVPNSVFDEALLGIKGEWFSKMNVNFKAGFRYQSYAESDIIADNAYIGFIMRGGFDYHPTVKDAIVLDLVRTPYESTYSDMNYYTANLAGLTYRHIFNKKLYFDLLGSYQLHQYPSQSTENGLTAKRYDNYLEGGAKLKYDIKRWLSLEAKYRYIQRISRFDIFNYIDNVITLSGTAGF